MNSGKLLSPDVDVEDIARDESERVIKRRHDDLFAMTGFLGEAFCAVVFGAASTALDAVRKVRGRKAQSP
jgi:hypothetical protein